MNSGSTDPYWSWPSNILDQKTLQRMRNDPRAEFQN